jgi:NADH-quinone oxidoreductase subunit E
MLSDALKEQIRKEAARYPQRKTALLPALKLAQAEHGWLPPDVQKEVAELVGVPHSAATELATFYSMLHTRPVAKTRVEVCIQLPCALRGAEATVTTLCERLGIKSDHHHGGTRADGAVEVHGTVECFGACHRAPMARLGDLYREHLDDKGLDALVAEVKGLAS